MSRTSVPYSNLTHAPFSKHSSSPFSLVEAARQMPIAPGELRVFLLDDQKLVAETIGHSLKGEVGLTYEYTTTPEQAVAQAVKFSPTVILQDLMMPEVDGFEMIRKYRAHPALREVPVIVMSTREDSEARTQAFAAGASDYVLKFPEKAELLARLRNHSKAYFHILERNVAFEALKESQAMLKSELEEADRYVRSLLPAPERTASLTADSNFISCTDLGGDAFGYHWMDDDTFLVYLADVCGHGVGAALLSVSVLNVLRTQSLPNVDFRRPSHVLSALNETFSMEENNQMYFTLWYGVYQASERKLRFASGGHPPAFIARSDPTRKAEQLATHNLVIGAYPNVVYEESETDVSSGDRLYVFSDGVYEVDYHDNSGLVGYKTFTKELSRPPRIYRSKLKEQLDFMRRLHGKKRFQDDYSIVEIVFRGRVDRYSYLNEVPELHQLERDLREFSHRKNIPDESQVKLLLSLDEAFTNIVRHGYPQGGTGEIRLELSVETNRVIATITDSGIPFNPIAYKTKPDLKAALPDRTVGGLGIYLIKESMDDLFYRRVRGRNILTLEKVFEPAEAMGI